MFLGCLLALILAGVYWAITLMLPPPAAPEGATAGPGQSAQDSEPREVSPEEIRKDTQSPRSIIPPGRLRCGV